MRKILGITMSLFICILFAFILYNSGIDTYNQSKTFYKKDLNGEVVKIVEGRGTKVFYNSEDFFYTHFCTDAQKIETTIKVGDVVKKQDSILEIFREDDSKEMVKILTAKVDKPADNYSSHFFGF